MQVRRHVVVVVVAACRAAPHGAAPSSARSARWRGRADLREHLDADEAAKHARLADEARDLASTPRSLLGRAVARDEVDDGTARCRHDA